MACCPPCRLELFIFQALELHGSSRRFGGRFIAEVFVRGLSSLGEDSNFSLPANILQDKPEDFVQAAFERTSAHGLDLKDMEVLAATYENLGRKEMAQKLDWLRPRHVQIMFETFKVPAVLGSLTTLTPGPSACAWLASLGLQL